MAHGKVALLTVTDRDHRFLRLAVAQARAQTYRNIDVLVVYNYQESHATSEPFLSAQSYLKQEEARESVDGVAVVPTFHTKPAGTTLGWLRNVGICTARRRGAEYIMCWDDDDLYSENRVREQVNALEKERLRTPRVCASTYISVIVNETDGKGLQQRPPRVPRQFQMHDRANEGWEMTLCCRLGGMPFYAEKDTGEDTGLLEKLRQGGRIAVMGVPDHYIYMRNATQHAASNEIEAGWWGLRKRSLTRDEVAKAAQRLGCLPPFLYGLLLAEGADAFPVPPPSGFLSVRSDGQIIGGSEQCPVALCGVSLFPSQWKGKYYNRKVIQWLHRDWKVQVVRAAMGIEEDGGYLTNPEGTRQRIQDVIHACLCEGIYVIVDWHSHWANSQVEEACEFFTMVAEMYGEYPHVLFEVWNEPCHKTKEDINGRNNMLPWSDCLSYHTQLIQVIRRHSGNLILVSTPEWSSNRSGLTAALADPAFFRERNNNISISLHAYMWGHGHVDGLIEAARAARESGCAVFVTEWGFDKSNKPREIQRELCKKWLSFLSEHGLSHVMWAISDKEDELFSALSPGSPEEGGWDGGRHLTAAGKYMKEICAASRSQAAPPSGPPQAEHRGAEPRFLVRLTRPVAAGIEGKKHHMHIRQLKAYNSRGGELHLTFHSASPLVRRGHEGRTPDKAVDGNFAEWTHSDYDGCEYGMEDHWMEFTAEDAIARAEIFNRSDQCGARLDGAYVEVWKDGAVDWIYQPLRHGEDPVTCEPTRMDPGTPRHAGAGPG